MGSRDEVGTLFLFRRFHIIERVRLMVNYVIHVAVRCVLCGGQSFSVSGVEVGCRWYRVVESVNAPM